MKTMTMWGAYAKLEALAVAAERMALPGRDEIRARVERLLCRSDLDKANLEAALLEWRGEVGQHQPRVANWLDASLFALLEYLDGEEVHLTGSELLDQLLEGYDDVDREARAEVARHHLCTIR